MEEKGAWSFGPAPEAETKGWSACLWPFTPRAQPVISFGGPVAEETLTLCNMFEMTGDEKPVKKALMALSSAVSTSQDSRIRVITFVHIEI